MKCVNCNNELEEHSKEELSECLSAIGIDLVEKTPVGIAAELGISLKINYRHGFIIYGGKLIKTDDIEKEVMRICLESCIPEDTEPEEKKQKKEKKQKIQDEPIVSFTSFSNEAEDEDGETPDL